MLIFIIPLQDPSTSSNWELTTRLLNRTLNSILRQKNSHFEIILVCNKAPKTLPQSRKLFVIEEEFKVPVRQQDRMNDKWAKVRRGLVSVSQNHREQLFVMIVDADDVIDRGLTDYVMGNADQAESGFLINEGYLYDEQSKHLFRKNEFDKFCGSSSIIKVNPADLPESMDTEKSHPILKFGHTVIAEYFAESGASLKAIPFRAAAYVTGTSVNDSGTDIRKIRSRRERIRRMFQRVWFLPSRLKKRLGL
jgi:hypothetical protein